MNSRNCPFLVSFLVFFSFSLFAQPTIGFFSPSSGPVGTSVTITGTNFSPTAAANVVYFGAVRAVVNAATPTSVTVTVPAGAVQQPLSLTVNNLTAYSAQPFMVTYPGGGTLAGRSFEQPDNVATSLYPYGLALGDFDNDGKPDVATVNNANVPASYVAVHRNTGGNGVVSFAPQNNLSIGDNGFGITTADFDGDGKLDLAATYIASNGNVSIYKNKSTAGNISFAPAVTYAAGSSPYTIAAGDVDGDGKPDLVICNYTGNTISVLRNTTASGVVSFAPTLTFTTALGPYDLALGDLDGDGKLDAVTGNQFSNNVSALRNTSTPGVISFAGKVDYPAGSAPLGVAIGDLDGDNKPEVAFVNSGDYTVSVLRNTGSAGSFSFAPRTNIPVPNLSSGSGGRVAISDLDGDTKADLIVSNGYVYLFKNSSTPGTLSFGSALTYVTLTPYRIGVADLDVDGKPDVAITNVSYQSFSVFRNRVPAPQLSSISPTTAAAGTSVTINGYNLTGATNVWFGDVPATSYTVNSANKITAVVGTGASGNVKVSTLYGTDSLGSFVFAGPPVISSASPTSAATGDTVFITGQNFNNAIAVAFGGTAASYFTVVSPGMIKAVVGSGASGALTVTTQYGTGSFNGFVHLPVPAVTSFTPVISATGTPVSITGRNFTGTTVVNFGGLPAASFTVVSPTQITALVGNGASGSVSVTNAYGTGTLAGFTYIPPPVVSSFMPTSAGPGMAVTLNGSNFLGVTGVAFGNRPASSFNVVSSTQLTAIVSGGASGDVSVTNAGGTATLAGFTFVPTPSVTNFTPRLTGPGGTITITGTDFSTATSVKIGGVAASSFLVINSTTITAIVASTATAGSISVTTLGGTANAGATFYFTSTPVVNSFSPRSGAIGTVVTLSGANFSTVAANNTVYFGGVRATVSSATQSQLVVTVPAGAHYGPITVTTNGLTAYSLLPYAVTFAGGGSFTANSFAGRTDFVTSGKPAGVAAGDLDGDGKPDAVVANTYSGTLSFFRNTSTDGGLAFAAKIDSNAGTNPHGLKLADIDGDGKLDVLCLNSLTNSNGMAADNTISIFRNKSTAGNISFEPRLVINTRNCPRDLAVGDLNMDGKPDLALTYNCWGGEQLVWVYRNTSLLGNVSFFQPQEVIVSGDAGSNYFLEDAVSVADINGDNRPDLVVGFGDGTFFSVAYNQASVGGQFLGMQYQCYSNGSGCWLGPGYGFATTADFNSDDKVDLVTTDRIVQNRSNNSIILFDHRIVNNISGIMAVDNLSGNAKPDFTAIGINTNALSVVKNSSTVDTVKFEAGVGYATAPNLSGVATADFNGDGKVDIAIANKDFNTFSVLLNRAASAGPVLTSFSPISGTTGTVMTLMGSGFTGVTAVSVGGVPVTSFTVVNSTTITAVVGSNASGNVSLTAIAGTASLGWFYRAPTISSFTPVAAGTGLTVTITGTDFIGATSVTVGGIAVSSFTVLSATTIDAVIGSGATGSISVTTPGGIATKAGFTYVVAPVVTSFSPASGPQGTVVTISGNNFTGATSVRFGATEAFSFTVVSPGIIAAIVGSGSTGNVFVTTPGGTVYAINQHFAFVAPPVITSFSPASGVPGSTITIIGTGFTGATSVGFGGTAAASFTVVNSTTLTAVVGTGASGNVSVTAPGGTASSPGFSFNFPTGLQAIGNIVDRLLIFPNPSDNSITVSHPSVPGVSTLQVTDMYGRLIKEIVLKRNASQSQVTLQGLSAGVYKIVWSNGKIASGAILFKK